MDELSGQDIRIILNIKEGREFGALKVPPGDKIFLEATLNGAVLDTDALSVTEEPLFDSELMWESNKKTLRRLRSGGATIKILCFLVNEAQMKRERIGHCTISLREAHVVPSGKSFEEIGGESWWHWQKLNGAKPPYPQLLYSLRLEGRPEMPDKLKLQQTGKETKTKSSPKKQQQKTKAVNPNLVTRLQSDRGVIQIGSDETATDYFTLTIYVGQAVNLNLLLPGNYTQTNQSENEQLCVHYSFMDFAINTANISMDDIHKPVSLNEKMVISLCSSLENLQQYFSASLNFLMRLIVGHTEIGFAEMQLKNLVPTTNKEVFCSLEDDNSVTIESQCFLRGFITREVPTSPSGHQPYIHLRIKLKYEESKLRDIGEGEGQMKIMEIGQPRMIRSSSYTILDTPSDPQYNIPTVDTQGDEDDYVDVYDNLVSEKQDQNYVDVKSARDREFQATNRNVNSRGYWQASGDIEEMNSKKLLKEIKAPIGQSQMSVSASHFRIPSTYVNKGCQSEQILHDISTQAPEKYDSSLHTYALNILVQSITLHQLPAQMKCFLRFHHPNAEIISNPYLVINVVQPNQSIPLQDVKCKLKFVSTPGEINHLLLGWPPRITVCDTSERKIALASLNLRALLAEETGRCCCSLKLIDPRTSEEIGMLKMALILEDCGQQHLGSTILQHPLSPEQSLGPVILDEKIPYRIVEELEDWKERQEIMFKAELKKKEEAHLAALTEEWNRKHSGLERNLTQRVEQCRHLVNSLSETNDELKIKSCKHAEREKELLRYKEVIEDKHRLKVRELKEAARRLEDDLILKITALEREKDDQETYIRKLEKENNLLKETIVSQEQKIEEIVKNSLTKDQTASLMQEMRNSQEKLDSALKSKSFFKDQWARAVRELHRYKSEHNQAIQIQIKQNKEELKNLGLHHLLLEGENELKEDKSAIQDLKKVLSGLMRNQDDNCQTNGVSPGFVYTAMSMNSLEPPKVIQSATEIATKIPENVTKSITNATKNENDDKETRIKALVEQRDSLMNTGMYSLGDPTISKLNQDIRELLIN